MKKITLSLFAVLIIHSATLAQSTIEVQSDVEIFESNTTHPDPVLDSYIRTALENNQGLRAAFDDWQAALEKIPQARALPDPTFEWTHFVEEVQTRTGPQNNRFMLAQKLPGKGKRAGAAQIASDEADQHWWQAVVLRTALVRDLKRAYYDYADLAQTIHIVDENLSLLRDLEPSVQSRVRGGANQSDLLRLQVEIGKLENELRSLETLRPSFDAALKSILNSDSVAAEPWPESLRPRHTSLDAATLRDQIDTNNPSLKVTQARIQQARSTRALRELANKPDFTVGLTYIETGDANGPMVSSDSGTDPFGFTVGVSIPLWRKKIEAGVQQAEHDASSHQNRLAQSRRNLHAQLERYLYQLENSAREMTLYQDTLIPRSRQTLELILVGYESGETSLLEFIDTEQEMLEFELGYWRAVKNYHLNLAEIEALCGGDFS